MTDMNVQKANENSFFGKNMTFGSAVHMTNALDHWAMIIYKKVDWYKQFHRIFKSPYCDVG